MFLWTRTFVELLMKPTRILKIVAIQYHFWMILFHYYAFINHVAPPFLSPLYTSVYIMHGAFYKVNTPIKFMYNVSLPSANRCPAGIPIFCPIVLGGKKAEGILFDPRTHTPAWLMVLLLNHALTASQNHWANETLVVSSAGNSPVKMYDFARVCAVRWRCWLAFIGGD